MATIQLHHDQAPKLLPSLMRAVFNSRPGFSKKTGLPEIEATWESAKIDRANFKAYLDCCGLKDDGYLPLLYPHVMASKMHLDTLTNAAFPIKLLGTVHFRNHIIQHRKIKLDEVLDMSMKITESRVMEKGLEFDFTTLITAEKQRVWESISTYYVRGKFGDEDAPSPLAEMDKLSNAPEVANWLVKSNMGKRYAKITGDYNPIHISSLLAKIFGFKRDLIHAFCVLATTLHHLPNPAADRPVRLDVAFKGPTYLGSKVSLKNQSSDLGERFDLFCADNDRPSISGKLMTVDEGERLFE